jgi:hypothetical protein
MGLLPVAGVFLTCPSEEDVFRGAGRLPEAGLDRRARAGSGQGLQEARADLRPADEQQGAYPARPQWPAINGSATFSASVIRLEKISRRRAGRSWSLVAPCRAR